MMNDKLITKPFDQMELPEGVTASMYDVSAFDGANAAHQVLHDLAQGRGDLEESLFRRDFLPILLKQVPMDDLITDRFYRAWIAIAGNLQAAIRITRNGEYAYTLPPLFSAFGSTKCDRIESRDPTLRQKLEMTQVQMDRVLNRGAQKAILEEAVFSVMPEFKVDPSHAKMWEIVLRENGINPSATTAAVKLDGDLDDGNFTEHGEEL